MNANQQVTSSGDVCIQSLSRAFNGQSVLEELDLFIPGGQFVALLGRSGSGKSTLLRALAGLDDDAQGQGSIRVPQYRSVLFQDSRLLPWDNVLANVTLGLNTANTDEAARSELSAVGLEGREYAWPNQLSGGEQQRVALARSLVRQPQLLLADEPFGALDALTRLKMHGLLRRLVAQHKPTVMLVTHDVDEALVLADRVLVLDRGHIVEDISIELEQPRVASLPALLPIRQRLLNCLGVDEYTYQDAHP
ncbi:MULTISPECIES: ABC transporter ATP-binding protein [Pseudomonas]|uniref:ABC transporter ATP-binding protein n=1 Tax=Pseudomonas TaxID=286 RepID=UPI0020A0F822|nr:MULTISPECIES: ABC transporter ATP-binding protein [Pseudomonas]MCP1479094.1 sulfonate transport system ATP-binding protein [Pseudomonas chlororaphis]MCP1594554.1 sulfonate transport system ATP-binding protein [Pseudomonas chlororaphis]WDG53604.1 ABC transporter ATP-binding protein [Pseudomonas chlororaphis]WDH91195.1 ABC transporter ATP-binding protein [Pseudomonas chlororaphis]WPO48956.1 ABC transporter ATP-binding protein [Pseudomonas sp. S1Bt23]